MKTDDIKALIIIVGAHAGVSIVKADQEGAKQPALPYGVYKVTSPHNKGRSTGNISQYTAGEAVYERLTTQPFMTISLNFFTDDTDSSRELAVKAHEWFSFVGDLYCIDKGIAVRNISNVENRTTHLGVHYEYKHGFDVQIRFEHHIDREIEFIQETNIQEAN